MLESLDIVARAPDQNLVPVLHCVDTLGPAVVARDDLDAVGLAPVNASAVVHDKAFECFSHALPTILFRIHCPPGCIRYSTFIPCSTTILVLPGA